MPIVLERPPGFGSRARATWSLLFGLFGLASLMAVGFGDVRRSWAIQPAWLVAVYVALSAIACFSVLAIFRRYSRASGSALTPGRYLLPLDAVEVPPLDANGQQILVVTPLGDARDARVRSRDGKHQLVLSMQGGTEIAFALRTPADGDAALKRLERSQHLLEEVTYKKNLETSLSQDAFFDVRADSSWDAVLPGGPVSARVRARRAWLQGSAAAVLVAIASAGLGVIGFAGRNFLSDGALYMHAVRVGTPEALQDYLTKGSAHQLEAIILQQKLVDQQEALAKQASASRKKARDTSAKAEWELTGEELALRRGTTEACLGALRARGSTHPTALTAIESLVHRASSKGEPQIPVRFKVTQEHLPEGIFDDTRARMTTAVRAFERVFSEVCPASIAKLVLVTDSFAIGAAPGFDVTLHVRWPSSPTFKAKANPKVVTLADEPFEVFAPTYVFDVVLHGAGNAADARFNLTMPPPATPSMALRARSLFLFGGEPPPEGTVDGRIYQVLSARAFDRLYDELWSLLFAGDPRVPLHEPEGDDPFAAGTPTMPKPRGRMPEK